MKLLIDTPEWAVPLLSPFRYKGIKGGRGSGKSHEFANQVVEALILDPNKSIVCIREIQKSLKFSAKKLIEDKILIMGVSHLFNITLTEIRPLSGKGIIIFQGMQDHTADSIKSLEGFDIAWVEEAHSLSHKSLQLLRPTIRAQDSELWFSWNPNMSTDAIDEFFASEPSNSILIHVNIFDNPFAPQTLLDECEEDRNNLDSEDFAHVWLGDYNVQSDALVFAPKDLQRFKLADLNRENRNTTISFVDVADQGLDSLCMPVGELIDDMIYIVDVVHSKEGSNFTIPLVSGMIKDLNVDRCVVESNAMGYIYGTNLQERVSIELDIIPSKGNKHHRIVGNSSYVKKYFVFRNDYEPGSSYDTYMREIFAYTKDGKAKHDDAPDATTGLALLKRELFD
jgi:predicted phage terminase large subunit-like protein